MVRITSIDRKGMVLQEILQPRALVTPNWWSPIHRIFTNSRILYIPYVGKPEFEAFWALKGWGLFTIVSHELKLTESEKDNIGRNDWTWAWITNHRMVKDEDGDPYIDEFGCNVFISTQLGPGPDRDERYEAGAAEPELFNLQWMYYETLHRKPDGTVQRRISDGPVGGVPPVGEPTWRTGV